MASGAGPGPGASLAILGIIRVGLGLSDSLRVGPGSGSPPRPADRTSITKSPSPTRHRGKHSGRPGHRDCHAGTGLRPPGPGRRAAQTQGTRSRRLRLSVARSVTVTLRAESESDSGSARRRAAGAGPNHWQSARRRLTVQPERHRDDRAALAAAIRLELEPCRPSILGYRRSDRRYRYTSITISKVQPSISSENDLGYRVRYDNSISQECFDIRYRMLKI